jgi:hypothetical protein
MGSRGALVRNLPYIFIVFQLNPCLKSYTGENKNNSIVVRNRLEPSPKSRHAKLTHTTTPKYCQWFQEMKGVRGTYKVSRHSNRHTDSVTVIVRTSLTPKTRGEQVPGARSPGRLNSV